MTLKFRQPDAADYFTFVAERSESVASVESLGTL